MVLPFITARRRLLAAAPAAADLISFTGDASTTGSNPSFAGMSFGDEPAGGDTRHIIVAIASFGSGGVAAGNASMTIGGVSATLLFRSLTFRNICCEIWIAEVPTGTTGTVAVTTVYANAHSIAVYKGINLATVVPTDTGGGYATTVGTDFSIPMDVLDGGAIVAVYSANTSFAEAARDIGNIEEDAANLGPGTWQAVHASMNSDSDQVVTLTATMGNATHAIAAVSFEGPAPAGPASYRYWRINVASSHGGTGMDWSEVEMRIGGVDQTGSGTAAASSSFAGNPASSAFDNNGTTRWASDFGGTWPQWLSYDFGTPKAIEDVKITVATATNRSPDIFAIQGSSDNTFWRTVKAFNTAPGDWVIGTPVTFTL